MKAILVHRTGGPDVLVEGNIHPGKPEAGEVLVRNLAIGVNYTDVYSRSGAFPADQLPFTPGKEAAGEIVAVGRDVKEFKPGDRVAYVETPGAYAEFRGPLGKRKLSYAKTNRRLYDEILLILERGMLFYDLMIHALVCKHKSILKRKRYLPLRH